MGMGPMDLGSGIGGGIGSIIGYFATQGDRDKADEYDREATDAYRGLGPAITAQQSQAVNQGPSAYDTMRVDSTGRAGMLDALAALKQRYMGGGLDAQAKADIANVNNQAAQQAAAQRGAVANNAAQRGLGSSGVSLAAQRAAGQSAANTSALGGLQALAMGQNRADAALNAYGGLSGNLQNYDYGAAANRAAADDAISKFNAQNQTQNNQYNATNRQNAEQQSFNNRYAQAGGIAGGLNRQADDKRRNAQQGQQLGYSIGSTVGGIGGAAAGGGF